MIPGRIVAAVLAVIVLPANAQGKEDILNRAGTAIFAQSATKATLTASNSHNVTLLPSLIAEALENNPEIQAAYQEREAAQQRVSPAEALDDPMLEAGVINAPLASSPFNREDMTMKMIGLSSVCLFRESAACVKMLPPRMPKPLSRAIMKRLIVLCTILKQLTLISGLRWK